MVLMALTFWGRQIDSFGAKGVATEDNLCFAGKVHLS